MLLDTQILIWILESEGAVPEEVQSLIERRDVTTYASVVSAVEMAVKISIGKLSLSSHSVEDALELTNALILDVSLPHCDALAKLPALHRDPFDRLLIAQAQTERIQLLTADVRLGEYGKFVRIVKR